MPATQPCENYEFRVMGAYQRRVTAIWRHVCRKGNLLTVSAQSVNEEKGPNADAPLPE